MEYLLFDRARWGESMTYSDPRVADWPLMSSPTPTILIVASYVIGIKWLQSYMKNREPVEGLKPVLIIYNLFLVCLSMWMVEEIARHAYFGIGYTWGCNNMSFENSDAHVGLAKALYVFWISKMIEFVDTILMALRKRNDQISFLHIYHHVSMPLLWWIGIKYTAGGDAYWTALFNSFVHVIMYSYYLFAALGYQIWWKPYLTQLQMFQFFINMFFSILSESGYCGPGYTYSVWLRRSLALYMFSLLILFGNFYIQAYLAKKRGGPKKKE